MTKRNGKSKPAPDLTQPIIWRDFRCRQCGRLLFRAIMVRGAIVEVRCPRCSFMTVVSDDGTITAEIKLPELEEAGT